MPLTAIAMPVTVIAMPVTAIAMPVTVVSAVTPAMVPVPLAIIVVFSKGRRHCQSTYHRSDGERQQGLADYRFDLPSLCCWGFHGDLLCLE